jgi:hypothetical protein
VKQTTHKITRNSPACCYQLLSMAFGELTYMRDSWNSIIATTKAISSNLFDEVNSDKRLKDPELAFKGYVFFAIVDTAMTQYWRAAFSFCMV